MSESESDVAAARTDGGASAAPERPPLANPETKDQIQDARDDLAERRDEQAPPEVSPAEAKAARRTLAREAAPDEQNPRPDLRVRTTVEFRGYDLEFVEIGRDELEASKFTDTDDDEVKSGTEAADYVYTVLGEKCIGIDGYAGFTPDEEWFSEFSLRDVKGEDGLMTLFMSVIEEFADDVDAEELEAAGN